MWCFGEGIGWWSWLGGFMMFVVGGGLITLILWLIIKLSREDSIEITNSTVDLAKERYARGEINKQQFEQIKKDLH